MLEFMQKLEGIEFPVEKHESFAGFDFMRRLKKTRVCLIYIYIFVLANCGTNCSTAVKFCKNMALFFCDIHQEPTVY